MSTIDSERTTLNPPDAAEKLRGSALPLIFGVAVIIFAADQATKFWIVQNFQLGESWSLSPEVARLVQIFYVKNTGAAFGMFPQMGNMFTIVALIVIVAIVIFHHHLPVEHRWVRVGLGLQVGGALGNMVDRLLYGYVVDFIDIGFWPIFNIADVAIVSGVLILARYLWEEEEKAQRDVIQG